MMKILLELTSAGNRRMDQDACSLGVPDMHVTVDSYQLQSTWVPKTGSICDFSLWTVASAGPVQGHPFEQPVVALYRTSLAASRGVGGTDVLAVAERTCSTNSISPTQRAFSVILCMTHLKFVYLTELFTLLHTTCCPVQIV